MPSPTPCVPCCTTPQVVDVPGVDGPAGADGANGVNAFTATTQNSPVITTIGSAYSFNVLDTSWMAVGELVFVSDGTHMGTFEVTTITSGTVVSLTFLGYPRDTTVPFTISSAAIVTPTGQKFTPATPQSLVGTGTFAVDNTTNLLNVASNPPSWTIPDVNTYAIFSRAKFDSTGLTYAAPTTLTLKLRRTNNTAADLLSITWTFPAAPVQNQSILALDMPPLFYTPAQANDIIELWGATSAAPTAGALNCKETFLGGYQLY